MRTMKELIAGYNHFKATRFQTQRHLYNSLADGQNPNVMLITCADSRVVPSSIFSVEPGEIFSVRNVANLVPPYSPDGGYHGTSAALEFAVTGLEVTDILVLGHTNCGGAKACLHHPEQAMGEFIGPWVNIASKARETVLAHVHDHPTEENYRHIEQEIVKLSLENLMTFPFVRSRVEKGSLALHGAIFSIPDAILHWYDAEKDNFSELAEPVKEFVHI